MKKFIFLLGLGLGFVLGSRAGRSTYDSMVESTQKLASNPEVKDTARKAGERAKKGAEYLKEHAPAAASSAAAAASSAATSAAEKVRSGLGSEEPETTSSTSTFQTVEENVDAVPAGKDDYHYPEGTVDNPAD